MPTDLLTAMLAGGNEGAAVNPFMLEAAPQLQTAQQLQQAGMSTAPATPAQGWGRLAQALAGTVMRHEATSDLAKAISGTSSEMAKLFPEGSIMRAGLSSPYPLVQAMTWQQIPKTIPLLSQAGEAGSKRGTQIIPAGAPANRPLTVWQPAQAGAAEGAEASGAGTLSAGWSSDPGNRKRAARDRANSPRARSGCTGTRWRQSVAKTSAAASTATARQLWAPPCWHGDGGKAACNSY